MSDEFIGTDVTKTSGDQSSQRVNSRFGLVALGVTGTIVAGLFVGTLPFLTPALRRICLPYVPATNTQIQNILQMCKGRSGLLVDLGSGDGRVVMAAAQAGYQSVGYELNLWLVLYSKLMARLRGLHHKASFFRADLWKTNLKDFDTIVIFGVDEMMPKLQEKFSDEMKCDAKVLACRFPLPDWQPEAVICAGIDTVWRYRKRSAKH
ncbi:protein N-lysine methyltransferase FAM173B-like [Dendronephthya gigantea]|uniref:protein N-lysine methyltransferase FAM173B-like n=1 Tax=Dendronephthya gigantea TaxID=151771 RepID=UPI00106B5D48|nr:protein N-lysine methyltransferase FAM173B-like [Dendronephthya gigantea]